MVVQLMVPFPGHGEQSLFHDPEAKSDIPQFTDKVILCHLADMQGTLLYCVALSVF